MEIQLDGFIIEGSKRIGKYSKFNLYRLHTRQSGKKAGEVVRKAEWYDATLEQCLKTIIQSKLSDIGQVTVDEYLKRYQKITEDLQKDIDKVKTTLNQLIESNNQ